MKECSEKKQVRLYGINKIDKNIIKLANDKDVIPDTREKLILKMSALRGTIRTNKGRYETTKNEDIRPEYYKIWKKAEEDLIKVSKKLEKLEGKKIVKKVQKKEIEKHKEFMKEQTKKQKEREKEKKKEKKMPEKLIKVVKNKK